jgi:hypothetical protein
MTTRTFATRAFVLFLVLSVWVTVLAMGMASAHATPTLRLAPASMPAYHCGAEDDLSWSWSRCGNHRRGIVTNWGNPRVVGICGFARLVRSHRVFGYGRGLQHLSGDRHALRVARARACDR